MATLYLVLLICCAAFFFIMVLTGGLDGHDVGGHPDTSSDSADHHYSVSQLFTVRNVMLLGTGIGAGGLVALHIGFSPAFSALIGFATGVGLVALVVFLFRMVRQQEGNSVISMSSVVGTQATVVLDIPPLGYGEIGVVNAGILSTYPARSEDGSPIQHGTIVKIDTVVAGTAYVSRA